jgi:hypothetical protein
MNSFKNPLTPLITDPVNIDRPIQTLQSALADLGWLEKCFGRAYDSRETVNGKDVLYPEVWQGEGKDLLSVLPNDNLKSQAFFYVEDPITCVEFFPDQYNLMQANVHLVVWFNLNEIGMALDYRYIEVLKAQVQRVITEVTLDPADQLRIISVYDKPENVFGKYSVSLIQKQDMIHPFGGFRFQIEVTYTEYCQVE